MKPLPPVSAACISLLILANPSLAQQPQHEAITQYRAFIAAVRAGKADDAIRLVEPVPKEAAPLLTASIKLHMLNDALKREVTAQMGPLPPGDPDELDETTRVTDGVLDSLKVEGKTRTWSCCARNSRGWRRK